jgi:hypothetical protein
MSQLHSGIAIVRMQKDDKAKDLSEAIKKIEFALKDL